MNEIKVCILRRITLKVDYLLKQFLSQQKVEQMDAERREYPTIYDFVLRTVEVLRHSDFLNPYLIYD